MARGANARVAIDWSSVPMLDGVRELALAGCVTGASGRNWAGYGDAVTLPAGWSPVDQALLTDPQTSGGLLVSCAPEAAAQVLARFHATGFGQAAVIGRMRAGAPRLEIRLS
jgi:selenide,water dikinase